MSAICIGISGHGLQYVTGSEIQNSFISPMATERDLMDISEKMMGFMIERTLQIVSLVNVSQPGSWVIKIHISVTNDRF